MFGSGELMTHTEVFPSRDLFKEEEEERPGERSERRRQDKM